MVRGLACRWAARCWGEERLQDGGERRHDAACVFSSRCTASASSSGTARRLPVRGDRAHVPEICRQQRNPGRDVAAVAVPAGQRTDRESMALMRNSA